MQADLRAGRSGLAPLPSPLWQPPNQLLQPTAASRPSAGAIPNTSLWEPVTPGGLPSWGRPQRVRGTLQPPTRKKRPPPWNPTLSISHFGRTGRDWAWTLLPEAKRTQLPLICRRRETQNQTSPKVWQNFIAFQIQNRIEFVGFFNSYGKLPSFMTFC